MKVVTISGSMRFQSQMIEIAQKLELENGWCVLQCIYNLDKEKLTAKQFEKLAVLHNKRIDLSDAVYVVNIDGYIGQACQNEIEYARSHGKEIIFHEKNIKG